MFLKCTELVSSRLLQTNHVDEFDRHGDKYQEQDIKAECKINTVAVLNPSNIPKCNNVPSF